jgi:hypothetical protein
MLNSHRERSHRATSRARRSVVGGPCPAGPALFCVLTSWRRSDFLTRRCLSALVSCANSTTMRVCCVAAVLCCCWFSGAEAFVAHTAGLIRTSSAISKQLSSSRHSKLDSCRSQLTMGRGTNAMIESVSCTVLKSVLSNSKEASISCAIKSSAMQLMRGNLQEAKVLGGNWSTPAGMVSFKLISLASSNS